MATLCTNRSSDLRPLVVKPREASRMLGCGRTRIYELLAARELDSFLDGRSRKITVESIHRYVAQRLAPPDVSSAPPQPCMRRMSNNEPTP